MPARIVRWGSLSTANINRAVIPPIRASGRSELAAVASRERGPAEAYAREWNIPRAHGSYEALLADPEVDAIYIGLPNSLHVEWAVRCAEAGKHVLCEKPLALTVAEVERMILAARRNNVALAEAFMYRHHPQTFQVREMIEQGLIGPVRTLNGAFAYYNSKPADVRWDPALGGGALWDVGCYPVSYARTVLGEEPNEVAGWQVATERGVDHTFVGVLRFPSGALATFDCGFRSASRQFMEIVGEGGSIRVPVPFKPGLSDHLLLERGGRAETVPSRPMDLYLGEIEDLEDAILEAKPPRISLEDSLANTRALVALYQSAREGRPMAV